jgi:hypothetical protein
VSISEVEAKMLAEQDRFLFGIGFYRRLPDGTAEYLSASEVFILSNPQPSVDANWG